MSISTTKKFRDKLLDFKTKCDYLNVHSSSVVPQNDVLFLFANTGMSMSINQFKTIFLGIVEENCEASERKKVDNKVKFIRAGDKHNDLDDVGKDVYHHTFFKMLGNRNFGDFDSEIFKWVWQLLTEEYGLDSEHLSITYFGDSDALKANDKFKNVWINEVGVLCLANRILSSYAKDNFWKMVDTGPFSELHYDCIDNRDAEHMVNIAVEPTGTIIVIVKTDNGIILGSDTLVSCNFTKTTIGYENKYHVFLKKPSFLIAGAGPTSIFNEMKLIIIGLTAHVSTLGDQNTFFDVISRSVDSFLRNPLIEYKGKVFHLLFTNGDVTYIFSSNDLKLNELNMIRKPIRAYGIQNSKVKKLIKKNSKKKFTVYQKVVVCKRAIVTAIKEEKRIVKNSKKLFRKIGGRIDFVDVSYDKETKTTNFQSFIAQSSITERADLHTNYGVRCLVTKE